MGTSAVKSTSITNLDATTAIRGNSWVHGGGAKHYAGTVETVLADGTGSTYRFFRVGSWMRCINLSLFNDALSVGTVNVGLWKPAVEGGAVVDADFFASAVSVVAAANGTNITYESANAATNMGIDQAEKRIWEVLGLTADPNVEYDVVIQPATTLDLAGTLTLTGAFAQ